MKAICLLCGNEFEAQRRTAKFCSESCKQKNKRGIKDSVSKPITTTETEESKQSLFSKVLENYN